MRPISNFLFTEFFIVCFRSLRGDCRRTTICTETLTCSEFHRDSWIRKREQVATLIRRIRNDTSNSQLAATRDSVHLMSSLCSDHLSAGFLLNDASDRWPIRCLWSADEKNGTCAPAPHMNGPIGYIVPSEWKQLIRKFREEIGCSPKEIEKVEKVQELYICKERCSHAGIGYIPSIFIMSTILFSWATFILPS